MFDTADNRDIISDCNIWELWNLAEKISEGLF